MQILKTSYGATKLAGEKNQLLNPFTILEGLGAGDGKVIADLGCGGVGYFVFAASKLVGDHGIVYAVDILKPNLEGIKSRAKSEGIYNIRTIWANLEVLSGTKIPTNTVDIALFINTLFQTRKHREVLHEAFRIIKPGGVLAVIDWKPVSMPIGPPAGERVGKERVREFAVLSGFTQGEEFEAGKYHYGIKFYKKK